MLGRTLIQRAHMQVWIIPLIYYAIESCTSQSCDQLQFDCIKTSHGNNQVPSPTHTIATMFQDVYPTTTITIANKLLAQSAGQDQTDTSILALGTIIGLLSLVMLLLIAGWIWTYWIMKKRETVLSRTDKYV